MAGFDDDWANESWAESSVAGSARDTRLEEWRNEYKRRYKKPNKFQTRAILRIQHDLEEIMSPDNQLTDIVAAPLDDNLFEWHGNLRGPAQTPFEGGVFHISMTFPETYPDIPPTVRLFNPPSNHPFVSGDTVCLNLLDFGAVRDTPYSGWSSVYSAQSILLQLQSFLLDGLEAAAASTGVNVNFSQKQTSEWKRVFENKDTHGEGTLGPEDIRDLMVEIGERKPSVAELALYYRMMSLPADCPIEFSTFLSILQRKREYRKIVENSNRYACNHVACSHKPQAPFPNFRPVPEEAVKHSGDLAELYESESICYHSKVTYKDDCLGVGVSFTRDFNTGEILNIHSTIDFVSLRAFRKEKVRKSSDNAKSFTHWLPVYICEEHAPKAMYLAERALGLICAGKASAFKPAHVATVFPKLLNTMVLNIIRGHVHVSVRAMDGFAFFHRMFLAFCDKYPEIRESITANVQAFIDSEEGRSVSKVPQVGELLAAMSVIDDLRWDDVQEAAVSEAFERAVKIIVRKHPDLDTSAESKADRTRIERSFDASRVIFQLYLFHRYFNKVVVHGPGASLSEIAANYDALFGRPAPSMVDDLQDAFFAITRIESHNDFLRQMGLPPMEDEQLLETLRNNVAASARRGYHGDLATSVLSAEDFVKETLKSVVPLSDLTIEGADKAAPNTDVLIEDEDRWRTMANARWGSEELPEYLSDTPQPWKHLYLQLNLQEILIKLNENPDFPSFYQTLELSAPVINYLEFEPFEPTNVKSGFFFLTQVITRLTNLSEFRIDRRQYSLGIKGCKALSKGLINNPRSLRVLNASYSNFASNCVSVLEEGLLAADCLIELNLEGNPLKGKGAQSLARVIKKHSSLRVLNIENCMIPEDGATPLANAIYHNHSIEVLKVGRNPLANGGMAQFMGALAYSTTITDLDMARIAITSTRGGLSGRGNVNAPTGKVYKRPLFGETFEPSRSVAHSLEKLFETNTSLKSVSFFKTMITPFLDSSVLHGLGRNTSITKLDFGNTNIADGLLFTLGYALAMNKNLKELYFNDNPQLRAFGDIHYAVHGLDPEDLALLSDDQKEEEALRPRGCNLEVLSLNTTDAGRHSLCLGLFITATTSLRELHLDDLRLGVAAGEHIGNGISCHPTLEYLSMKNNNLGEHGAKRLARGLAQNTVLKYLDVSINNIGGRGTKAIASVLEVETVALEELILFHNLCGTEGARGVAESLAKNKTLTKLDLGMNRIRDKGLNCLSEALSVNTTLSELRVKLNYISDAAAATAADAVSSNKNSSVTLIAFAGNALTNEGILAVMDLLKGTSAVIDIAERVQVTAPERMQATVWVSPLPESVSSAAVKAFFYAKKCGAIKSVTIKSHRNKAIFTKAKYAFVEFASTDSVKLALEVNADRPRIGKTEFAICRAVNKNARKDVEDEVQQANSGWDVLSVGGYYPTQYY